MGYVPNVFFNMCVYMCPFGATATYSFEKSVALVNTLPCTRNVIQKPCV